MTLRLSDEQAATLKLVARTDGLSISEVVRLAIDDHVKARRADPGWRRRAEDDLASRRRALDVAGRDGGGGA